MNVDAQLQSEVARRLLGSSIPARLAFLGKDGHPNVAPIWFVWRDGRIVMCSAARSAKVRAIRAHPESAVTIDSQSVPYESVRARGRAVLEQVDGVAPEYIECAHRYYGVERGDAWIDLIRPAMSRMMRICLTPEWVEVWDFRQRFPDLFGEAGS